MRTMRIGKLPSRILPAAFLLACMACETATDRQAATVEPPDSDEDSRLVVPEGDGRPVLLDGVFSSGEWEDATAVVADSSVTLHFKRNRGDVFIGANLTNLHVPVIDVFLQSGEGPIMQFHASAQLGERELSAHGEENDPAFHWGVTSGWYANEVRWDQIVRDSLLTEGVDPNEARLATMVRYDGFELQLRRAKLGGSEWRLHVEVMAGPDYEIPHVYPEGTDRRSTDGWLVLELGPVRDG